MENKESIVTPKLSRIADLALKHQGEPLKSIHHYMDRWWLEDAFHQLDAKKAPGIDNVTKDLYGERLAENIEDLTIQSLFKALSWNGKWVIDLDIRRFFDTIDHRLMREFFSKRIKDGVLNRLVLGWLKAGVVQDDRWRASEEGTPQGGNVSPLLANLYLHEVLDDWFVKEVQPRLKGDSGMVRYADDAVLYFDRKEEAERVLKVLHKRLEKFGLQLHPEKTRLVDFTRSMTKNRQSTFSFLGFTFYWAKSRRGKPTVKLKTERKRKAAKKKALTRWIKANRHLPRHEQYQVLSAKLRGLHQYYGVSFNASMLSGLNWHVAVT